jgi:hypothetical protein
MQKRGLVTYEPIRIVTSVVDIHIQKSIGLINNGIKSPPIITKLNFFIIIVDMKYGIISALLMVLIASCNKEVSDPEPQLTVDPMPQFAVSAQKFESSSRLLKREVSYTNNNPFLKNVRMFAYDNTKRCTEIKIGTIDSSIINPVFNLTQTLTFAYNGSTLVPSSFSSVKTVLPNLVTTFYYKYNDQGRKISDSVRVKNQAGDPADRVIHYVYDDNDKVYATPVLTGFSMENNSLDTLSLLTRGNIERLVSRIIKAAGDQIVSYTFSYDQSVSPYNKLNIANSLYFESAALGIGYNVPLETHYMGVTTNNMTSWTTGNYTVTFTYLYTADQYPVRKQMFLPGDVIPYQVTLFEY